MYKPLVYLLGFCELLIIAKGIGMEKPMSEKTKEYQSQLYFVKDVRCERAKTYFLQLLEDQLGFAEAVGYYSAHKNDPTIKPLELFLKRFTAEVIVRAVILRNPRLREHEYGNECKSAIQGLEMSECFLYYLKTGQTEGRLSKKEWYCYWGSLERLKTSHTPFINS